jgi:hypothetical protein
MELRDTNGSRFFFVLSSRQHLSCSSPNMSATPILDLEETPPNPPPIKWIAVLIGGLVGLLLGLLPSVKLQHLPGFNGLLLLPAYYVAVGAHELGHLLVGSSVGMPPGALVVGGIVLFIRPAMASSVRQSPDSRWRNGKSATSENGYPTGGICMDDRRWADRKRSIHCGLSSSRVQIR